MPALRRVAAAAAAAVLFAHAPTRAQEAETAGEDERAAAPGGIEAITVTAEKREQDLQDLGLSIQAYTGDDLERMSLTSTEDFGALVPGLTFNGSSQNPGQLSISGRGLIHADNNPAVASTVGVYIDGVFIQSGNASLLDLLDIKSVQFLKGPQGTLFGRNTLGGALIIETQKPTPDFGYKARFRVGEHSRRDYMATVNIPLVGETLLSRLSFGHTRQDGFYKNDGPDTFEFNDDDDKTARVALRFLPTDDLTVDYTFDWFEMREHLRLNPVNQVHTSSFLAGCAPGVFFCDQFGRLNLAGIATVPNNGGATVQQTLLQFNPMNWRDEDMKTFFGGTDGNDQRRTTWNHSVTVAWDAREDLEVKLISGWHRNKMDVFSDQDGTPFAIADFGTKMFHRSFNTEAQFIGTVLDGRIDYVLGAMWWEEEYDIDNYGGVYADTTIQLQSSTRNVADSYALGYFGQATLHVTDKLEFTGGLRYSTERKEMTRDICAGSLAGVANTINWTRRSEPSNCRVPDGTDTNGDGEPDVVFDRKFKERFDAWSPLARLSYHWTDELMTYVKWSKGFAAGGFGPRSSNGGVAANAPYEPEFVFSWEAGFKSRWFDNRLQLNASGFYDDYDDAQVTTFIPGAGVATRVQNAGKARIRGYEADLRAVPFGGLEVTLTHAWTYATFSEFNDVRNGVPTNIADEREFAHLPKRKWSGSLRYTFPPLDFGTFELFGLFLREGPRAALSDKVQNAFITSNTYTIYDGRVALYDAFGIEGLSIALVGKNLSDRRYKYSQGIDFNPLGWTNFRVSDPRRFFVEVSFDRL